MVDYLEWAMDSIPPEAVDDNYTCQYILSEDDENEDEKENNAGDKEKDKAVHSPVKTLEPGKELVVDRTTYKMLHAAQTGAPCLSFDIIHDALGSSRDKYPMSMYLLAGTQAARPHVNNLLIMKMTNLYGEKSANEDESDEKSSDSQDEGDKMPKMTFAPIRHQGCVNRVRCTQIGGKILAATWSELGRVNIWNLQEQLQAVDDPSLLAAYKEKIKNPESVIKPIFTSKAHNTEGFGLDWCPTQTPNLATGDCIGNIHIWRFKEGGPWLVDQRPYTNHGPCSVEDLQWSPTESNVLASCSVDKSIRIWDVRGSPRAACVLTAANAHDADVNVISWNRKETRFMISGGDDGIVKIWDLRQFSTNSPTPVAVFKQHTAPVTTLEWHPDEATIFASGGADDQIAQWDLSVEVDKSEEAKGSELAGLPPQLLFIHKGQTDVKEVHWHPQCPGTMVSTAHSGFNVFRTISV